MSDDANWARLEERNVNGRRFEVVAEIVVAADPPSEEWVRCPDVTAVGWVYVGGGFAPMAAIETPPASEA